MNSADHDRNWYRHDGGTFLCSTNKSYIQIDALNAALDSEMLWWADPLPGETMQRMIDNTLCFGLYAIEQAGGDQTGSLVMPFASHATYPLSFSRFKLTRQQKRSAPWSGSRGSSRTR